MYFIFQFILLLANKQLLSILDLMAGQVIIAIVLYIIIIISKPTITTFIFLPNNFNKYGINKTINITILLVSNLSGIIKTHIFNNKIIMYIKLLLQYQPYLNFYFYLSFLWTYNHLLNFCSAPFYYCITLTFYLS